jgi:hypothetical protein
MIWCFISSTLFDCHQERAYGALFESPDCKVTITFSMVGFVDDSTGTVNDFANNAATVENFLSKLQHDAQLWNDLLWCSGGMLELPKCSYHFLHFEFDDSGAPHPLGGAVIPITPKSVFDPHKTLGHYQSPAGSAKIQLTKIRQKQSTLSQQLASSPATRSQASTYYHTIYLPSIYVLPQMFFTAKELDTEEKKSMPIIFAKEGFNRNTSCALLYGPSDYADGGHFRWKWLQGEGQIMNFLKYWRTDGQVSTMLRIAVSWFQQHAGVSFSLFDDVHTPIPYAAARWLNSLRTFLATVDGQLELDATYLPESQRQRDLHLMDIVVTTGAFTPEIQAIMNFCQLSMNVITISDISNAAGTHLIPGVEWGELDQFPSTSTHHQTNQPSPKVFFWIYWQRFLHVIAHRPLDA